MRCKCCRHVEELSSVHPDDMNRRLAVFTNFGIPAGTLLGRMVRRYPAVLYLADPHRMAETVEGALSFFNRKEVRARFSPRPCCR